MNIKDLIQDAEALPVEERALVVDSLLRSLNPPESKIDEKWAAVTAKRLKEVRSGAVESVPGEEVFARIWRDRAE
ncbi:addiction module protein [Halorhodospira halochloris]|uniref:Addiction module component n=1 Tax=Halorhodospira halochloris TaxID=1052 RepID=A0A120MZX1_HALHR|nr:MULTISPECIES: addiction module protein [Halorhodospira]MBK1652125.1 addiction module protein [Halorhodospira halochloris]MBK1736065.1 addiction module protein [Halorhodospira abdelmalekii]MCG5531019.1 addiction module protein [Halorhodospira halochloris]MCG5548994.1 addiction module protein [Halorhodospira halochloris]BAU58048.1 putative addiction module component [Halorhodospira halochloris]